MHRTLRLTGLLAFAALPLTAHAQSGEIRPISFGISAGLSLPMGDASDSYSSGYNVTGHVAFRPAAFTNLSFRGDVGFDRFNAKESVSLATLEGTLTAIGVTANAVYAFPQSDMSAMLRPYVLGGVGFYNTKHDLTVEVGEGVEVDEGSDTNMGLQAGAGVEFALSGFSTFAEVKFVNVMGDGGSLRWIPVSFGFRF